MYTCFTLTNVDKIKSLHLDIFFIFYRLKRTLPLHYYLAIFKPWLGFINNNIYILYVSKSTFQILHKIANQKSFFTS